MKVKIVFFIIFLIVSVRALALSNTTVSPATTSSTQVDFAPTPPFERNFCSVKMNNGDVPVYFNVDGTSAWFYCGTLKTAMFKLYGSTGIYYDRDPLKSPSLCSRQLDTDTNLEIVSADTSKSDNLCGLNGVLDTLLPNTR